MDGDTRVGDGVALVVGELGTGLVDHPAEGGARRRQEQFLAGEVLHPEGPGGRGEGVAGRRDHHVLLGEELAGPHLGVVDREGDHPEVEVTLDEDYPAEAGKISTILGYVGIGLCVLYVILRVFLTVFVIAAEI